MFPHAGTAIPALRVAVERVDSEGGAHVDVGEILGRRFFEVAGRPVEQISMIICASLRWWSVWVEICKAICVMLGFMSSHPTHRYQVSSIVLASRRNHTHVEGEYVRDLGRVPTCFGVVATTHSPIDLISR